MAQGKKKKPKRVIEPNLYKKPKWKEPTIEELPLAWRFSSCDRAGPFSWNDLSPPDKFKEVVNKLHEFENKNWEQLLSTGSHPIECWKLEKEARDRLSDIGQDDIDQLMSFRLSGPNRVWCIQTANIMRVLWWDPDHKVCKAEKDKGDRRRRNRR